MTDEQLERALDNIVRGRLKSIETLAWGHLYDWSMKDKTIREHLEYIRKDLLTLFTTRLEEARQAEKERIIEKLKGIFPYPKMVMPMNLKILLQILKGGADDTTN